MASYADERIAAIRSRNLQSKRRAREMELRIAKYLLGHRIPMSGAGALKGDCEVVTDKVGKIFIECKYTAGRDKSNHPQIRLNFSWFDKMERDAISMRAKFAALIFRYHGLRLSDYVIMPISAFVRYDDANRLINVAIIDGGDAHGMNLRRGTIDNAWQMNPNKENIALLYCSRGQYVLMDLETFKDIIHGPLDTE